MLARPRLQAACFFFSSPQPRPAGATRRPVRRRPRPLRDPGPARAGRSSSRTSSKHPAPSTRRSGATRSATSATTRRSTTLRARERPGRGRQPRDRGAQGALPGLPVHLGQRQHERRFEFHYGRVEVRAKLPTGNGTWPAIWMLGTNIDQVGWPACGEIDIMENVGFDPTDLRHDPHRGLQPRRGPRRANVTIANPWEDFHVYAMEWYADRIDIFVDGRKYFTFPNEGTGSRAWPFDKPQYLLLNLAIGGAWGGQKGIDDSLFPHRLWSTT